MLNSALKLTLTYLLYSRNSVSETEILLYKVFVGMIIVVSNLQELMCVCVCVFYIFSLKEFCFELIDPERKYCKKAEHIKTHQFW